MYADLDAALTFAKHLTMLAAQGRQSATLRGVVSSVRMCETLGIADTVVTPHHWAICKAADRAYAHLPPRRIWANAHTLQVLDARTSGPFATAVVALACLGTAPCWRVSEAASVRPADLATPWRVAFYDPMSQRRWITAQLSHWGEAWRKRLHAIVQHRLGWIPLFASTAELQHALLVALMGTMWHSVAWHAFRRLGATALAATGAAMAVTARWGRWKSERQAAEYATPALDWEWEFPALLPLPAPGGGGRARYAQCRRWKSGQWQSWVVRPPRERRTQHPYQSSSPTPATTATTGYWGLLYRLMEYAPDDATANSQEPTQDLPGRAAPQVQRRTVRVRVRTRCALRRRPPAGRHKFQGQQSVEGPPPEMSPPGEPTACGKCGDALPAHMRAAPGKVSSRL